MGCSVLLKLDFLCQCKMKIGILLSELLHILGTVMGLLLHEGVQKLKEVEVSLDVLEVLARL